MRKEKEKKLEEYIDWFPPPDGLFNLPRVVVIPMPQELAARMVKFLFVFGNGDSFFKRKDFFVTWDEEKKEFLYLPAEMFDSKGSLKNFGKEGAQDLDKPTKLKKVNKEFTEEKINAIKDNVFGAPGHNHDWPVKAVSGYDAKDVRLAIERGHGYWKAWPRQSMQYGLSHQHKNDPTFRRLLKHTRFQVDYFLEFFDKASFVLMKDVVNPARQFKSVKSYDPYTVVRSFLKHIGFYPVRQEGSKKRLRFSRDENDDIRKRLREWEVSNKKKPSPAVAKRIIEYVTQRTSSTHQAQNVIA